MSSSLTPAFLNCFLALVTLAKVVPSTFAACALASGLIVPITLSCKAPSTTCTSIASIGSTDFTPAASAKASATSGETSPVAAVTTSASVTFATSLISAASKSNSSVLSALAAF